MAEPTLTRRPIAARDTNWARKIAAALARAKVRPNTISVLSVLCAAASGAALFWSIDGVPPFNSLLLFAGALFIQARLLCNLFDGMVAVEGGLKSKSGEIYNELPDRVADSIILVAAGYASGHEFGPLLGWTGALLAVITAYVRTLGAAAGASQEFCGPMAKQQRMFLVTVAAIGTIIENLLQAEHRSLAMALVLVDFGCVLTIARRTVRIIKKLESQ